MKLIVIAVSREAHGNFEFGLTNSIWGFTKRYPDAAEISAGTPILLGTNYENRNGRGNPRVEFDLYRDGKIKWAVAARATGPVRDVLNVPLWPDEVAENDVKYPIRFPMAPLETIRDLEFDRFPKEFARAFHLSINGQGKPVAIDVDRATLDQIAAHGRLPVWPVAENEEVASEEVDTDEMTGKKRKSRGAGRSQDAAANKAVEQHAVARAVRHYEEAGWHVEEKGKPYDLHCTREGVPPLRVEVKGTRSLGANVELTINEVNSAYDHPSELFVVRNIRIDRVDGEPVASGGDHRVFADWRPKKLRPIKFRYEVPWEGELAARTEAVEYVVGQS